MAPTTTPVTIGIVNAYASELMLIEAIDHVGIDVKKQARAALFPQN